MIQLLNIKHYNSLLSVQLQSKLLIAHASSEHVMINFYLGQLTISYVWHLASVQKKKRVKNTEEFCHHGNLLIFILTACSWIYWAVDHFLESVALTMCKLRWNHLLTSHRIFYLKDNQRIAALSAWNFKSWYKLSTETRGKALCVLKFNYDFFQE